VIRSLEIAGPELAADSLRLDFRLRTAWRSLRRGRGPAGPTAAARGAQHCAPTRAPRGLRAATIGSVHGDVVGAGRLGISVCERHRCARGSASTSADAARRPALPVRRRGRSRRKSASAESRRV